MNMVRAIAFNVRGQNLETDAYRRPRTGGLAQDRGLRLFRPTPLHGMILLRVSQHGWKQSDERQSQDPLFQLPETLFRPGQSAQARLPDSMSELHETDYLR